MPTDRQMPTPSPGNSRPPERARRNRDEAGATSAIVVLMAVALLSAAALVIDGGYALGAQRRAMNTAEQAARAGSDALSPAALRSGQTRVDPSAAAFAAQAYLASAGASGSVRVNGGQVTVTVAARQDTTILAAVGVSSIPISATATALSIDEDGP